MAAAQHWAAGSTSRGPDEVDDDLAAMGAPASVRETYRTRQAPERECQVWPENWDTVQLFLRVQTQWRTAALAGVIGLDYPAVRLVAESCDTAWTPDLFEGLQVMEFAALEVLNKKHG